MKKAVFWFYILVLLNGCGGGDTLNSYTKEDLDENNITTDTIISSDQENNSVEDTNITDDEISTSQEEDNITIEESIPIQIEENITIEDINYTDEELTLYVGKEYVTPFGQSDNRADITELAFKGSLPVENGVAILREDHSFEFNLSWENPEYAENVNFYFFNGTQQSIHYLSMPISDSDSYHLECTMLKYFRYECGGINIDDSQYYSSQLPIRSSFVMAVCDRDTRDPDRICDYIRIPIKLTD